MDGLCRGCRFDRTWLHLCFCAAVICSESLWQILDRPGIFIVYDPQHATFFLGKIRKRRSVSIVGRDFRFCKQMIFWELFFQRCFRRFLGI